MKTKPILFNTLMVQAILEGRKTQTRRIIKNIPEDTFKIWFDGGEWIVENEKGQCWTNKLESKYQKDDILWVRETFTIKPPIDAEQDWITFIYKATDSIECYDVKWKPSIFMPKEAARIFLKVTNIRVERLHDISENDAIAEGVGAGFQMNAGYPDYEHIINGICTLTQDSAYASFISLWQKINGNWDENPFVWVYEFERTEKPENFI